MFFLLDFFMEVRAGRANRQVDDHLINALGNCNLIAQFHKIFYWSRNGPAMGQLIWDEYIKILSKNYTPLLNIYLLSKISIFP